MPKFVSQKPVALVTGGSKRIGAAISRYLAGKGFLVAVHYDHSQTDAEDLCIEIKKNGGVAFPFQADLRSDDLNLLYNEIEQKLGSISLLVNNASIFQDDALLDLDDNVWEDHFKIHVKAPAFLSQAMANSFLSRQENKGGLIINMVDQRVLRLNPHFFSYTLSKSALWTATKTMAQALAPKIRVNAIGPGPSLKNNNQTDSDFAEQCRTLPLQKGPNLTEFGATICYLWDTPSITGQLIALDGGQHLMWNTPDLDWD